MKTRQQVHNIDSWLTKITTIVRTRPCLSLIVPGIHIYIVNNGVSPFVFSRPVNHVSRSADGAFLGNDFSGGNKPGKAAIFLGSRVPLSRAAPRFPLWSRQPLTSPASDILSATHRTKKRLASSVTPLFRNATSSSLALLTRHLFSLSFCL